MQRIGDWRCGLAAAGMTRGCLSLMVVLSAAVYSPAGVAKTTHVTQGAEKIDSPTSSWPGLTRLPAVICERCNPRQQSSHGDGRVKPGHDGVSSTRHHVAGSSAHRASVAAKHARKALASRSTTHASAKQAHRGAGGQRAIEHFQIQTDRPLIVIDPGHGGNDPGAIGVTGTEEKTITLATAQELQHTLSQSGRYRIALTRTGDRSVTLGQRLAFARKHDADLLIAIHADASRDHRARGASVYISSNDVTTHFAADTRSAGMMARAMAGPEPEPGSAWLQSTMIEQLADDVRMTDSPARHAHLYVLASHKIPSVLLEVGFLSNQQDESLLRQAAHRRVLVQAISDAIDDYFAAFKEPASRT